MLPTDSSDAAFEHMFNLAPVSLWLEDYSALKALFERWRVEGVEDLQAHLQSDPLLLSQCSTSLKVLRVNQRTLDLFSAASQSELLGLFIRELTEDPLQAPGLKLQA